jgi:hypothetical protein
VAKITDSVLDDVPNFIVTLKKSAVKLESLFGEITMIVEGFRNADGTVKRLMRDPALYEKLLTTLDNVEQITDEVDKMLRTDVKPIANNVKILTDKAARDPAIFIRNLIRKQPPTKGALPIWGDNLGSDSLCDLDTFQREMLWEDGEVPYSDGTIIEESPSSGPAPVIETESKYIKPALPGIKSARLTLNRISMLLPSVFSKGNELESPQFTEPKPLTSAPLTSQPLPPLKNRQKDETIPEEGRIVYIDPRYETESSVYQQTSYTAEKNEMPRLIFTR